MKCSKCSAWLPDDAVFCSECGQKVEPVQAKTAGSAFCAGCGMPLPEGAAFCGNCGTRNEVLVKPKKDHKKMGKIAALAAIAIVVAVAAVSGLKLGGKKSGGYVGYILDKEMYVSKLPTLSNSVQVTKDLGSRMDLDNQDLAGMADTLSYNTVLSSDGKRLFYLDKLSSDGYTLYYMNLKKSKSEPVKIESNLSGGYMVNEKGTIVTYLKNDNLYQHNLKEKVKVATDVHNYVTSVDGKSVAYIRDYANGEGGTLYVKKGNKEERKIASDVTSLTYASDDLSLLMYRKDDILYRVVKNGDPEKIASDVLYVYKVYDSGACYYSTQDEHTITYWSVIKNDMGDDGQSYRKQLEDRTMDNPIWSLVYFDGKESTVITEAMTSSYSSAKDLEAIGYTALESGALPEIRLSDFLNGGQDIYGLLTGAMEDETKTYVTFGADALDLGMEDVRSLKIYSRNTMFASSEYDAEDETYLIYKLTLNNGSVKNKELLADDVCSSTFYDDESYLYIKDVDDSCGDLYLNGKKVDEDVYTSYRYYDMDAGKLYYFKDYDQDDKEGILQVWNGKKAETLAEEVHEYQVLEGGRVVYLGDYSVSRYKGDLYTCKNQKSKKVVDDVVSFFVISSSDVD